MELGGFFPHFWVAFFTPNDLGFHNDGGTPEFTTCTLRFARYPLLRRVGNCPLKWMDTLSPIIMEVENPP